MQKRVIQKSNDHTKAGSRHVLLLQGPVGPFFKHLRTHLEKVGYKCSRMIFNPADGFYAGSGENIRFSGSLWEWQSWLRTALLQKRFDAVVGFGCFRPIHKVARDVAQETRTPYLSLEEGYLRSGFVTVDFHGNNAASPLAGRLPPPEFDPDASFSVPLKNFRSFGSMCRHGALYYTLSTILTRPEQRRLFHRSPNLWKETFFWSRNVVRYFHKRSADFRVIEQLLEHSDRRYFLVPLQVAADSQMGPPALGWTTSRLIDEVLASFARSSPPEYRLVFKLHPLERGHSNARTYVGHAADRLGIADRVDVLDTGSLGLLTRHAAGMITINSSSGLSAIAHGTPLLVVGRALYSHPALATCAEGKPDFDRFWVNHKVADAGLRRRYLAWIMREALVPGDFYAAEGIEQACLGIVQRLAGLVQLDAAPNRLTSFRDEIGRLTQDGMAIAAPTRSAA